MKTLNHKIRERIKKDPVFESNLLYGNWIKELGTRIAEKRKESGMTQGQLAESIDAKQSYIARIEAGKNITCETLWKLSESFDSELCVFGASKKAEKKKLDLFCGIGAGDYSIVITGSYVNTTPLQEGVVEAGSTLKLNKSNNPNNYAKGRFLLGSQGFQNVFAGHINC